MEQSRTCIRRPGVAIRGRRRVRCPPQHVRVPVRSPSSPIPPFPQASCSLSTTPLVCHEAGTTPTSGVDGRRPHRFAPPHCVPWSGFSFRTDGALRRFPRERCPCVRRGRCRARVSGVAPPVGRPRGGSPVDVRTPLPCATGNPIRSPPTRTRRSSPPRSKGPDSRGGDDSSASRQRRTGRERRTRIP